MEIPEEKRADEVTLLFLGSVILVVVASFYTNLYAKNYHYFVEATCDPATEECYVRDCDAEECPPNGLSSYRVYSIPSTAFTSCKDNSCDNICVSQNSPCQEILCSSQSDVECQGPSSLEDDG